MIERAPKKSLGQHWLYDTDVLEAMCDGIEADEHDTVLEIGPGLGTLTTQLLARNSHVVALEFDHELAQNLPDNVAKLGGNGANLETVEGDIRTFNLTQLPADYKLCANIPYYLTSNLIRMLCDTQNKPLSAALLIQKEVAERVVAEDGKMSILSCFAHFYYECELGGYVPARLFTPPPKVDSQILIMRRRAEPLFSVEEKLYFRIVKAGFSGKRKTLRNSLSAGLHIPKEQTEQLLMASGISYSRRAESLTMEEWQALYDQVKILDALSNVA